MPNQLTALITTLTMVLTLVAGPGALAHGNHDGALFSPEFAEFANARFRIKPLPANETTSYVVFDDGRRVYLDSDLRAAVQDMAGALVQSKRPASFHHDVDWREWSRFVATSAVDNVKHLFSRRFVLEIAGSGVQAFYRFGILSATLIVIAEAIEHTIISPILPGVPLCQAVYASCVFFSREAQEIANVINPVNMKPLTLSERVRRWVASRRERRHVNRALKHVYRVGDDVDLTRLARNRSFRDSTAGSGAIYGGWFGRGFFRSVLADVVAEDHDHDEDQLDLDTVEIPVMTSLADYHDDAIRAFKTEEYIAFIELIFEHANLSVSDLSRTEENDVRVPLKTTALKTKGFLALNRDLARMRKSFDLYAFGLRMRAFQSAPRSLETLMIDQEFATSFGAFIHAFNPRLRDVDALAASPLDEASPLRTRPDHMFRRLREWMRSAKFCDSALTSGLLTAP